MNYDNELLLFSNYTVADYFLDSSIDVQINMSVRGLVLCKVSQKEDTALEIFTINKYCTRL